MFIKTQLEVETLQRTVDSDLHFGIMRTMHAAGVGRGEMKLSHKDNIQNIEVLAHLRFLREKHPSATLDEHVEHQFAPRQPPAMEPTVND